MSHTGKRCMVVLLGLAALVLAGCGYGTHSLYRDDIKTIYVQFFDNDTFRRQLEVSLTSDIVEEIKLRTPLVFAPRDEADSVLSGTIVSAAVSPVIREQPDKIFLERAKVEVRFRWRDRLTGRDIVAEQVVGVMARSTAPPTNGVFVDSPDQTDIFALALQEAARRVVDNMEQRW